MKKKSFYFIPAFYLLIILAAVSCKSAKYAYTNKHENRNMVVQESHNVIDYKALRQQDIPSFASRGSGACATDGV